ncbi:MAG: S41 family peptidase [Bryobacteraceae bacterium]|nr:S41 family peptidase [Bryobacteraceae bacterium]
MAMSWRSTLFVPAVVGAFAVLGGIYGPGVVGVAAAAGNQDDLSANIRMFTSVYELVENNFADKVNPDKAVYKGAIPGMLRTLDPHSSFFDPRDFRVLREEQRGHYYGVGMTVSERDGKTIVIAPFPGSPAYKAGIRPGDTILEVNDKRTDGLTTTEVADLLKGPRGTQVQVVVGREGHDQPLKFNIIRDEIERKSVPDAFWLKPGIAYLAIDSFNENTSREVEENLKRLGEDNVKGLILDLRNNPGGLLNEGVLVADRFLQKNQTIVSHRGRSSAERPYVVRHGSNGHDYPIVVLVNRYSASAAEIVSGALQDHDRAWILGENTFGKGLVQTVYPLGENTGLALTTAKYYTPSGRLIQRDYQNRSFYDYYFRKDLETKNPDDVKLTDSGRTVYGGGGIAPDEKFEQEKLNRFQTELLRKYAFFNFTAKYFGKTDAKLPKNWEPDTQIMNEFHKYLLDSGIRFTEAEFAENHDWVKRRLRLEVYTTAFSIEESRRLTIETDPMVAKAIESLPKAKSLLENAKKMIVQRVNNSKSETH